MQKRKFTRRWGTSINLEAVAPGVFEREGGGFLVRGRAIDPFGRLREFKQVLPHADLPTARRTLYEGLEAIRNGTVSAAKEKVLLAEFAASLFEEKLQKNRIASAKSREKWEFILRLHILPTFGEFPATEPIPTDVVEDWLSRMTRLTKENGERYSPVTINSWFDLLTVILNAAARRFRWPWNPIQDVEPIDTSTHQTYTEEEPNSLTPEELKSFLAKLRELFPQHYAMVALGFATGLRPSSLRPLRRKGPNPDILWDGGLLLVRQSHTIRDEVMTKTKQGTRYKIPLPPGLVEILRWHEANLPEGPMADSDLLFPSTTGGFAASSALQDPFAKVAKAAGIQKRITPRAMRRTFQDLARAANVRDLVTRSISGHATETMQHHYSTVAREEMREAISKVTELAGFGEVANAAAHGGAEVVREPSNENGDEDGSTEIPNKNR